MCDVARGLRPPRARAGALAQGAQVVVAGGCDFYPGSTASSPHFSFAVTGLRIAGEGDLLARIERVRRRLVAEGLCEPQKALARPALPRTIGVVCGERGKARDDVLAGLQRRGWAGRLVWAFAPVQDRHAAPAVGRALSELAALPDVDVAIVARGGGSLADLLAFCDETLCRTVALLRVPVIASVGHHTDRTLIDDVAAVSCSTPTHAAEAAVPLHVGAAREALGRGSARLARHGRRAVADRARVLARLSRAPGEHVARHRRALHQDLRELRASARRRVDAEEAGDRSSCRGAGPACGGGRRPAADVARAAAGRPRRRARGARPRAHARPRLRARAGRRRRARDRRRRRTRGRGRPDPLRRRRSAGNPEGRDMTDVTYETASGRLESIIERLDSGEAGLRETLELCREGRGLVEFCAGELDAVSQGLDALRLDELVARLEG